VFGAGALITGNIVNKRQGAQLRLLDSGLTEAKERVANAELRTAELLKEIQPRYFTDKQKDELSKSLPALTGYALLIGSLRYDVESALLAKQIKSAFNRRGIGLGADSIDRISGYPPIVTGALFGPGPDPPSEIRVGVEVWASESELAELVVKELRSIGKLEVNAPPKAPYPFVMPERFIAIFVGAKPIPEAK
jgi:hypothetical protein